MLTGKELAESGMLTGFEESQIQQQGIDIRISKINKIKNKKVGVIPKEGRTGIPEFEEMQPLHLKNGDTRVFGWLLPVGVYDIEFIEGVNVQPNACMKIITRSSLVRNGSLVESGLFDAGFHTDHMGGMLFVNNPIVIEVGARVAQVVCFESGVVENLYNGQWQGDNQRNV